MGLARLLDPAHVDADDARADERRPDPLRRAATARAWCSAPPRLPLRSARKSAHQVSPTDEGLAPVTTLGSGPTRGPLDRHDLVGPRVARIGAASPSPPTSTISPARLRAGETAPRSRTWHGALLRGRLPQRRRPTCVRTGRLDRIIAADWSTGLVRAEAGLTIGGAAVRLRCRAAGSCRSPPAPNS